MAGLRPPSKSRWRSRRRLSSITATSWSMGWRHTSDSINPAVGTRLATPPASLQIPW